MKQEKSLPRKYQRAPKSAAIAGIVFSVLLTISLVSILIAMPLNLRDGGAWLSTHRNTLLLAFNLLPFAGIAFLWFIGVVRDRLGRDEDRFISTVFIGSGLLFLAMLFVQGAIVGSIILLFANQTNSLLMSGSYNFGRAIAHEIFNTYALKMAGIFMISTSTLFIRSKTIPRWMVLLGYGLALLMLLRISHIDRLGWVSLAFPLWVFLISLYILIDNYRRGSKSLPT